MLDSDGREGVGARRWVRGVVAASLMLLAAAVGGLAYVVAPDRWHSPSEPSPVLAGLLVRYSGLEGTAPRPYLGVTYQELNRPSKEHSDMQAVAGALVTSVTPSGPAAMGGLQTGDVILAIDGEVIQRDAPLLKLLLKHLPGHRVRLIVQRGQNHLSLDISLGRQ